MRLAILYYRFGPYHLARLRAASARGELIAVEGSERDRVYAWKTVHSSDGIDRRVLFPDADVADQPLPLVRRRVGELLSAAAPDVVAVPSWGFTASLFALEWCFRRGTPAVVMTDSQYRDFPRTRWKESLKRQVVRCCAGAFVAGRRSAEYVQLLGIPPDAIRTGCNVVDNRHFAEGADAARADADAVRSRLGLPRRYLLASSRFVRRKNLSRLIRAFAVAARPGDAGDATAGGWHLVLLGDGELRPRIERTIERLGLAGRVRLPGFRQYAELPAFYGLAEAFVHVGRSEPWGLVVNEAMAAGLPVAVSDDCGCVPELVRPDNGLVCEAGSDEEIAAALRALMDPARDRAAMGRASRERIGGFSPESFAERLWESAEIAARRGAGGNRRAVWLAPRMAGWLRRIGEA